MSYIETDWQTFLQDDGAVRLFRMYVFRKLFTPYEQQKAFIDESEYESIHARFVFIVESIELPDKDILLGVKEISDAEDMDDEKYEKLPILYYKLSEIRLEYHPSDIDEF